MNRKAKESLQQVQQLRLSQRLNPQNVALGRLLEMSVPELEDEIRRELDDNPALEVREANDNDSQERDFTESSEELQLADYADADDIPAYMQKAKNRAADDPIYEAAALAADDGDSLIEALMQRLASEYRLSDSDLKIAENIIGNIDANGYMTRSLAAIADDIAINEGIEPEPDDMNRIFRQIRALDPAGIGAIDLRDCLLLQIDRLEPSVRARTAREIIANYFDLFSKKHYDRLLSQLEISRENLIEALDLIKSLNPKPASALDLARPSDRARHISPDIALDYDAVSDSFTITLLGNIPELAIEESFAAMSEPEHSPQTTTAARQRQKQAFAFIKRKRDDAESFIRLIEMRSTTLLVIAKAIVNFQRQFFISGEKADIRPMILRDIAANTGLDLSVISRASAGKYILTSHGIYPLKLFFNERPDADNDISSHEILNAISTLIQAEDKHAPMSDQAICEALAIKGYDIARRTVAKYRERLGFPVARLRKQI
ncbi:MAG: RNA polymerase factor sigma-54 [Muribaculaceae bacterium]|nr:RNA polymerase factor sigma-54 [Muribaculaceae bacterium]